MNPNIYKLSEMTKEQYDFVMRRAELDITEQMKIAKEVSDDIRVRGDEAVLEYTEKFDRVKFTADTMKVTPEEIENGYKNCDKETREAIEYAYKNIYDLEYKQKYNEIYESKLKEDADKIRDLRTQSYIIDTASLDVPVGEDEDSLMGDFVADESSNTEDIVDNKVLRQYLLELIDEVAMTEPNETSRERTKTVLIERFGLDGKKPKTQREIAKMLNISRSYVSRIETKAIEKLAKEIKE